MRSVELHARILSEEKGHDIDDDGIDGVQAFLSSLLPPAAKREEKLVRILIFRPEVTEQPIDVSFERHTLFQGKLPNI